MTCKELRWHFDDHLRDGEVWCARGAVAEHAATCPDCARFVAEQRELRRSLRQIRESAGSVPQSVDVSVLSNYRRHMADRGVRHGVSVNGRFRPRLAWGLAGLAAALIVLGGLTLRSRHSITDPGMPATTAQANGASAGGSPRNPHPQPQAHINPRPATVKRARNLSPEKAVRLPLQTVRSLPEGFRSLMYCDELSCPQDMDVIRVQLPLSVMPRQVSTFIPTSRSVTADVLVGPDGVARGIRLEEIEF